MLIRRTARNSSLEKEGGRKGGMDTGRKE
jgi:hypothetical protein